MGEIIEIFQTQEWAMRALIASSQVGIMCGVLGCFIVLRNMALIGDALAHAILPGVVFAFILVGYNSLAFFTGSVLAGLFTVIGITWIQHNVKTKNDAAIGIVFTAMFAIGVIGISWISRSEGVHLDLKDFLFGNVLGIKNQDLYLISGVLIYVLLSIIVFYRYLFATTFQPVIAETMGISVKFVHYFLMLLLSFAVVASLQTVGVILVVAMLITPAATALLLSDKLNWVLVISGTIGFFSAVLGLLLAIMFETPPGPAMTLTATAFYLLAALLAPKKGLIFRFFRKRKQEQKVQLEDTLKQSLKLHELGMLSFKNLIARLGYSKAQLTKHLNTLQTRGLLERNNQQFKLSTLGIDEAQQLVRAHRLWETYLVEKIGLTGEQIHEDAEKYEHLLTEELLDEVDASLGYPSMDPHGSPIPSKKGLPSFPLSHLDLAKTATIASTQVNEQISSRLWQLGLLPNMTISILKKDETTIQLKANDQHINISSTLARQINITPAK
ncbi:MAG: iron chelate uptake ABC transporter family permease subunit [Saprospiraceae bacterium]